MTTVDETSLRALDAYRKRDVAALERAYRGWQPPSDLPSQADVVAPAMHRAAVDDRRGAWIQQITQLSLLVDRLWVPDLVGYAVTKLRNQLGTHSPLDSLSGGTHGFSISAHSAVDRALSVHAPFDSWLNPGRDMDSISAHAPLDSWVGVLRTSGRVERAASVILAEAASTMEALGPLVECGAISIYPVESLYMGHVASQLFGKPRGFTPSELIDPELYVAECLAMARSLKASYAALSRRELRSLEAIDGTDLVRPSATEERLVASFATSRVKLLDDLTPELAAEIRRDEPAFDDFRAMLRGFVQQIPVSPTDGRFARELDGVMKDVVTPQLEKLAHAIETRLWRHTRGASISFCAGVFAGIVATGDPTKAIGTAGASALATILGKILFERDDLRPAHRVVLALTER